MANTGEQGTDQWLLDRAGKFTGSEFCNVLARNKKTGEPLKAYHDLIWQVAVERLTELPEVGPNSFALRWGKDVEPFAREAYEMETGLLVEQSGFVPHPKYPFIGCSPDGLVGTKGGLEMKCPKSSAIHLARFLEGMPEEHVAQVQGGMMVCEREWWDFVSYDPRFKERHRLFRVRVMRDQAYIDNLEKEILKAEELVQEIIKKVSRDPEAPAAVAVGLIDAIAKLATLPTIEAMSAHAESIGEAARNDDRFTKAFKKRMDELKNGRKS